jgi:hypothetical protein
MPNREISIHARFVELLLQLGHPFMKFLSLALILCATSCERVGKDSNISFTATQISIFRTALDAFREETGRFPSTPEGLLPLIIRPRYL